MHQSVVDFVAEEVEKLKLDDPWIVEVGSLNVNDDGELRKLFPDSKKYAGIDLKAGPGVDYVTSLEFWPINSTDLILCTEVLEHDRFFWKTVAQMWDVLTPGGHAIVTARAFTSTNIEVEKPNAECYPMHCPPDYWRFTKDGLHWLFISLQFRVLTIKNDPYLPGVFLTVKKQ